MALNPDELYKRYGPMVYRRCKQLLRDEQASEDAMQETFVNLIRSKDRLDDEYPSSLLYRMATNVCLNQMRGQRRRAEDKDEETLLAIADSEDQVTTGFFSRFLEQIFLTQDKHSRESTRVIAVLHYVDGMTLEETAKEVGMSVSGIRKRLRTLRSDALELLALSEISHGEQA